MELWKPKDGWRRAPWLHVACFVSGCLVVGSEWVRDLFQLALFPWLLTDWTIGWGQSSAFELANLLFLILLIGTVVAVATRLTSQYVFATIFGLVVATHLWAATHAAYYYLGMIDFQPDPANPYVGCRDCFFDDVGTGFWPFLVWLLSALTLLIATALDLARNRFSN